MKVVLLAAASSIHTVRWANGIAGAGHEVHVVSQHPVVDPFDPEVIVHVFPYRNALGYFTLVPTVRKLVRTVRPDLINAHYASGYGTTARLLDHHPFVLSVWGSDVYEFPYKSPLHKWLVQKNLRAADQVASTSRCMAKHTKSLVPELSDIAITPFGVDLTAFEGIKAEAPLPKRKLVIGTIKTMRPQYGIDILIRAYAEIEKRFGCSSDLDVPELELRLVGGGDQTTELQALAKSLGVSESVSFVNRVSHAEVPKELAKLDIYVALSRRESFGVAIIEASAAGRPVVVSDAGGLPEVAIEGETGFIVQRENPQAAADVLEKLVLDAALRFRLGTSGQRHVAEHYTWSTCVLTMLDVYERTIQKFLAGR